MRLMLSGQRVREHLLDVLGQVRREGREQDAVGRSGEDLLGQVPGPVHGHDRLARACPAQHPGRAVELLGDQLLLAGVEEDPPLLQRGVENRGQVVCPTGW